ncbi:hypothetical protein P59_095 [Bacillus phage P59]|nr:hypothetical protein P59_095 [Bacillus phage P59]
MEQETINNENIEEEITEMDIFVLISSEGFIEGWSTTPSGADNEVTLTVKKDHAFFTTPFTYYKLVDGGLVYSSDRELLAAKQEKNRELDAICKATILGRFPAIVDGVEYFFSNDIEAQANFEKLDKAFDKGFLTAIPWTCYDAEGGVHRIVLTAETFPVVYFAHLNHIQGNIAKYRDILQPMVAEATEDELKNIQWEGVEAPTLPTPTPTPTPPPEEPSEPPTEEPMDPEEPTEPVEPPVEEPTDPPPPDEGTTDSMKITTVKDTGSTHVFKLFTDLFKRTNAKLY